MTPVRVGDACAAQCSGGSHFRLLLASRLPSLRPSLSWAPVIELIKTRFEETPRKADQIVSLLHVLRAWR